MTSMTRQFLIGVALMFFLALPSLAMAQAGGVQDGVKLGKVFVSGENPGIRLLDKENGTVLAAASFWRIIWSPVGPGHVCYLTTGDGKSPNDLRVALVDNQKLYEFLTSQILGTFNQSYVERPVHRSSSDVHEIGRSGQGMEGSLQIGRREVHDRTRLARLLRAVSARHAGGTSGQSVRRHVVLHSRQGCPDHHQRQFVGRQRLSSDARPCTEQHGVSGVFGNVDQIKRTGHITSGPRESTSRGAGTVER